MIENAVSTERPEVLVAHAYFQAYDAHPLAHMCPLPPLQPASLASWLIQEGKTSVVQWDSTFRVGSASFEVAVSRIAPRVVWLYTHPTTRESAGVMLAAARRSGAVVLAGGPDAALKPAYYLHSGADAVIAGEGEQETLGLILALRAGRYRCSEALLRRSPGVQYLDSYGTVRRAEGTLAPVHIERLPRPDRDPVETRIHIQRWRDIGRKSTLSLLTARGCPVPCGYCTNSVSGRAYRRRLPASVVDEMEELVYAYDLDRLLFDDETFLIDSLWLREFAEELKRRGLRIAFEGSAHPKQLDAKLLPLLQEVGLDQVHLHAASGSSRLLESLNWSYSPADIYGASSSLREVGVAVDLQVFVGLPGEGRADLDASMEMVRVIKPDGVEVTRVDPGSPALSRKNWERVVGGPLAQMVRSADAPASSVLDAAETWMRSVGRPRSGEPSDVLRSALGQVGRPLLRALVRGLPGRGG